MIKTQYAETKREFKQTETTPLTLSEQHLEVRKTNKKGQGLFTKRKILKGKIAFRMKGEIKKRLYKNRQEASAEPNMMGIGKNLWIDPVGAGRFINHSCNPNLGIKGRITFIALRDIPPEEELTFDYSTSEDSEWVMTCQCESPFCRKTIGSVRDLPEELFKKIRHSTPKHFQKIYYRYNKNHHDGKEN